MIDAKEQEQPRRTAVVVAVVFGLIAVWCFWREWLPAALTLASLAGLLLVIGFFVPVLARVFHTGWMAMARVLGYVNSRILLSLIFYLVFTPYGAVSRLLRRDPLNRRSPARPSYWITRTNTRQPKERFERLF